MTQTPLLFHIRDYRGATIEDLNIPPAISVTPSTSLFEAIEIAYENEFTYLPVIHEVNKRLLGVLNVDTLTIDRIKRSFLKPIVKNYMLWFNQNAREKYQQEHQEGKQEPGAAKRSIKTTILKPKTPKGKRYQILTPLTPLEELAEFFNTGTYFAIITNGQGNFVYGVATPQDLMKYENARPKL
ncbi:uncharacterized protein J8A68_003323 [[Candida] subhashii]|uniref:CBS domain-containing protein n=1 Tax=[Candida] subhashii TaxID=561895 RepID=A0A8J5QVU1_9ASCO|nr:uncharacterized protein J8A68_003323 [[Candida] subhashii]KAG7663145.1 hypothetical protein J8A68_003323 [[Candida] subhashii]